MSISSTEIDDVQGAVMRSTDDDRIGTVGQVYVDPDGTPVWATVKTGLFGTSESFVPLADATFDGEALHVGWAKDFIKDAPRVDADGELDERETDALYDYYGMGSGSGDSEAPREGAARDGARSEPEYDPYGFDGGTEGRDASTPVTPRPGGSARGDRPVEGRDTSGPTTDDAMTRSEERLQVGTERTETGRARLRKHVVTEQQTVTVPVTHDEVSLSREPIDAANAGDAMAGGDLTEEEHEVVLTADRVVTSKETVPVERVKLGTDQVTEQQQRTEDVRKEQIDLDDPSGTARG